MKSTDLQQFIEQTTFDFERGLIDEYTYKYILVTLGVKA